MKHWIRDLWRGWSDEDLEAALLKVAEGSKKAGGLIPMSCREMRAYIAFYRDQLSIGR